MSAFNTEPTPNPNSVKITTDDGPFIDSGMVALSSAEEADPHPLGRALFAIEGVVNVLILPQFVTISKTDAADWNEILPHVERVLRDHLNRGD